MRSKGVFIVTGVFIAAAAAMVYIGSSPELIVFLSGIVMVVLGVMLLVKEISWRSKSVIVPAKVVRYYNYNQDNNRDTGPASMYTMEAEYTTAAGKILRAGEQSGSSSRKFPEGTDIRVRYSIENPELFIAEGDNSRVYAMLAVTGMGAVIIFIFGYILVNPGMAR